MTEAELVEANLQGLARYIQLKLPDQWGFILLCFPFGPDGRMMYVANARRPDVVRAMYEFINATKDSYATDEADDDAELGRLRQRVAELEEILNARGIIEPGQGKS